MRGISAAARTLGLSQPQLSRRLRRFEDQMGTRLFDRTPNGLMLTPAGERLLPLAVEMKKVANGVKRVQPELASKSRRVVRVSLDEVRELFLLRHATALRDALPHADIEFYSAHQHLDHATRETDVQIRSCLPESDTLVAKKLGDLPYAVYRSRDFVAADGVSAVEDVHWVGLSTDRIWYPEIHRWIDETLRYAPKLRVNTMTGALRAVRAGVGYGVLPCFMGDEAPDLVAVPAFGVVEMARENLILHRDLLRDRTIRIAVDTIVGLYRREQAGLAA